MMNGPGYGADPKPDMAEMAGTPRPMYPLAPGYLVSVVRVVLLAATVAFLLLCALLSIAITIPRPSRPVGAPAFPTLAATRALPSLTLPTATPAIPGTATRTTTPTPTRRAGNPPPAPTATPTDLPPVPTVTPAPPTPTDTLPPSPTTVPTPTPGNTG